MNAVAYRWSDADEGGGGGELVIGPRVESGPVVWLIRKFHAGECSLRQTDTSHGFGVPRGALIPWFRGVRACAAPDLAGHRGRAPGA